MICSSHMATLELSNSSVTIEQGSYPGPGSGSMQRPRGVARNRDASDTSESEPPAAASMPPRPSRNNSKLKVLVRSHAMREETSPPREPTPTPCITLIPSPEVASPSISPPTTPPESSVRTQLNGDLNLKVTITSTSDMTNSNSNSSPNQKHFCDCFNKSCAKCAKNNNNNSVNNNNVNTLTVSRANVAKHKLRQQSSSQGSFEGSSTATASPCLSRDNSTEQYTDTTGVDLTQFILETLNKNAKDRVMMLKIEQELVSLAKDKIKTHFKFPSMSSYQRMLVHRCAAFFGMDHNIEMSGKCVVVNKTKNTRIPEFRFKDHIRDDFLFPEEPRRSILKRDSNSFEDCNYKSPDRQFDNRRSKSFEEREEEYEKARRRIFKDGSMQDCGSQEDFNWAEMPWPENECSKIRLLPPEQNSKQSRLLKVQSVDGKSETLRPCVAKSYSFGGYGGAVSVLTRGDSVSSTHSAGPRLLTKQDSSTSTISWRLSPSSSGYKSQSQRSDSVTPSPTATPHQLSDASEETVEQAQQTDRDMDPTSVDGNQLVWAVTDMQSVPKGSVLIDPQSGQPFTNQDGSIYHFDPSNPPPGFASKPPPSPPKIPSPQKSPIKEPPPLPPPQYQPQSPKKLPKAKPSPLKNKALINSATSPSLPMTPPIQAPQTVGPPVAYTPNTPIENPTNMPLQPYPVYPTNGFVQQNVPAEGSVPVYQPQLGMVYTTPYMPPPYENRTEPSVPDLSGYFVNMSVSDPSTQTVTYQQPTSGYWNQQSVYYQPPANQQHQRYPVQIPVNQNQGTYPYPPNYVPVNPNPPVAPTNELVPVYPNHPMQMVYPQQQNPQNTVYIQNPNPMYVQNPVYPSYPNL